jgi:hypothetical protein
MKYVKFITVMTLILTAFLNTQSVVALPTAQPTLVSVNLVPAVQSGDDDNDGTENGNECSIFGFPSCEAHAY